MKFAGRVARVWKKRNVYTVLVGETERKKSLGRPSRRWHYSTELAIKETGRNKANLFNVAQKKRKVAGCCEYGKKLLDPEISGNFLNI